MMMKPIAFTPFDYRRKNNKDSSCRLDALTESRHSIPETSLRNLKIWDDEDDDPLQQFRYSQATKQSIQNDESKEILKTDKDDGVLFTIDVTAEGRAKDVFISNLSFDGSLAEISDCEEETEIVAPPIIPSIDNIDVDVVPCLPYRKPSVFDMACVSPVKQVNAKDYRPVYEFHATAVTAISQKVNGAFDTAPPTYPRRMASLLDAATSTFQTVPQQSEFPQNQQPVFTSSEKLNKMKVQPSLKELLAEFTSVESINEPHQRTADPDQPSKDKLLLSIAAHGKTPRIDEFADTSSTAASFGDLKNNLFNKQGRHQQLHRRRPSDWVPSQPIRETSLAEFRSSVNPVIQSSGCYLVEPDSRSNFLLRSSHSSGNSAFSSLC